MDTQIKGQTAFVTAGAHGIGEAIANLLTQEGARVLVADRDGAALHEKASSKQTLQLWRGLIARYPRCGLASTDIRTF